MSDLDTDDPVTDDAASDAASDEADDTRRARPSLGPVIALGLAAAVVVAALLVVLVGGDDVSPVALTVDGTRTTSATLDGELDGFSGSTYFQNGFAQGTPPQQFSAGNGSLNAIGTSYWLSFRTQTVLAEQILARHDVTLTQAQVNTQSRSLASQGVTAGMSSEAAEQLARFQAAQVALMKQFDTYAGYRSAMRREAKRTNVVLDPKYGRWDAKTLSYCVPLGCRAGGLTVVPPAQTAASSSGG